MKKSLSLALLALGLAGCVNVGNRANVPGPVYYVLHDERAATPATATPAATEAATQTLLVPDTTASSFYDTDQLVFSRGVGTRGQYQFARWTERPGKRFADLLRSRLVEQGNWQVTAATGYVRSDRVLDTELVEFYHDAASSPGEVRLVLRAELIDLKQRALLGRQVFEQRVPVTSYDAAGAAQASSIAVGRVLDALVAWLASFK